VYKRQAISRKLIEMHDGTIWVKSRVGEGSTFFVALPADLKEDESAATESALASAQAQPATKLR
jgi:chemotaxis protein histidine kinase CheA